MGRGRHIWSACCLASSEACVGQLARCQMFTLLTGGLASFIHQLVPSVLSMQLLSMPMGLVPGLETTASGAPPRYCGRLAA